MNREPAYRAGFRVSGVRFCSVLGIALYPLKSAQNRSTLWRSAAQSAAQRSHFFAAGLPFAPQSSVKPLPPPPSEPLAVLACMRKPSAATAIAITALVVAAAGTGAAATRYAITNKNQIAPKVLAQLHGAQGKRGPKGDPGAQGTNGTPGATGAPGPFPTTLPYGKTVVGTLIAQDLGLTVNKPPDYGISWTWPLATAPTVEILENGTTDAHCTGSEPVPSAAPGYLCVYYDGDPETAPVQDLIASDSPLNGAAFFPKTSAPYFVIASWAVTGD